MRVFQLNTFCGIKSTGRITTDIALLLEQQGDQCIIGYGAESVPDAYKRFAYRIGNPLERKIHGAIRKFFDGEGYGSIAGTLRLIKEIERFQPNVIHLHNLHGCYLHLGILFRFLQKAEIPLVWTLHDCWSFTGHCAYFNYIDCEKWKTECHHCTQLRSYPVCLGIDGSCRNQRRKKKLVHGLKSVTLVPPCHWLAKYIPDSILREYPIRVICNGVDREVFRPVDPKNLREKHKISAKYLVLAVAADWDERKGMKYLLEAASKLSDDYQIAILGLLPEQMAGLPHNVLGLQATGNVEELAQWYSAADCLANPTMEDNMPLVNLEALACGTPVAVFRTGGCVEAVDDTCGIVAPQGDSAALAQAIQQLAPQKQTLSDACVKRSELFDSKQCYREYLALYKELCK